MADQKLNLRILTPDKILFEGEVDKLIVPATDGELGILPKHAPLVSLLGMGEMRATANGTVDYYALFGGYIHVSTDHVSVLAEEAEPHATIDGGLAKEKLAELTNIPAGKRSDDDLAEMVKCRVRMKIKSRGE